MDTEGAARASEPTTDQPQQQGPSHREDNGAPKPKKKDWKPSSGSIPDKNGLHGGRASPPLTAKEPGRKLKMYERCITDSGVIGLV